MHWLKSVHIISFLVRKSAIDKMVPAKGKKLTIREITSLANFKLICKIELRQA